MRLNLAGILAEVISMFKGIITKSKYWPTTDFLLDFHSGIGIVSEEACGAIGKTPKCVQVKDGATLIKDLLYFRVTPRTNRHKLHWPVITVVAVLVPNFGQFFLHASLTGGGPSICLRDEWEAPNERDQIAT